MLNPRAPRDAKKLVEKNAIIRRASRFAPPTFRVGNDYVAKGIAYPLTPRFPLPRRTVFRKRTISIEGSRYHPELKGYGADGGDLYINEHDSGDVYYGMYLENAVKEFERLQWAHDEGLQVVLPLMVAAIPRDEFLRKGLLGFRDLIENQLDGSIVGNEYLNRDALNELIGFRPTETTQQTSRRLVEHILLDYSTPEEGFRKALDKIAGDGFGERPLARAADAFLSGKPVGFVMRAAKNPYRVGDPSENNLTPENREIARRMGHTFRVMAGHGYIHTCPGTGNWTLAGELTDFSDVIKLPEERGLLDKHVANLNEDRTVSQKPFGDMRDFLAYLMGEEHCGTLTPDFLEGVCGERNMDRAVETTIKFL